MTVAEIEALPAGRELDVMVADRLMGGRDETHSRFVYPDCHIGNHAPVCWVKAEPKPYSTDIAAAWEVLNRLDREWWPEVGRMTSGEWYCDICRGAPLPAQVGPEVRVVAETAPLAICRAVLRVTLERHSNSRMYLQ